MRALAPSRTRLAAALVACLLGASCGRTEEPPGRTAKAAAPAVAQLPTAADVSPEAAAEPSRCLSPLSEPPAPEARPADDCPSASEPAPILPKARVQFVDAQGKPSVQVEVAETATHRERGLMFRTQMSADSGMIFTWPDEARRGFWMRNTCIPLDMLFIARDGFIAGALEQVPVMNEAPRTVPCDAMHVLEVNAGYLRKHGIRPGQRVEITKKN
jgi:hypothetical protein